MSIPEFGDMIACRAAALIGANELFDDTQVRMFGLVESGETPWGWLHVYRIFNGTFGVPSYFLIVKDKEPKELIRFTVDKDVVADAIASDLSVIGYALTKHPKAVVWIAENFEPQFHAIVERIRMSMTSSMATANSGGPKRT